MFSCCLPHILQVYLSLSRTLLLRVWVQSILYGCVFEIPPHQAGLFFPILLIDNFFLCSKESILPLRWGLPLLKGICPFLKPWVFPNPAILIFSLCSCECLGSPLFPLFQGTPFPFNFLFSQPCFVIPILYIYYYTIPRHFVDLDLDRSKLYQH